MVSVSALRIRPMQLPTSHWH